MTIKDFEAKIQREINKDLSIIPHPTSLDMNSVFFKKAFLCGVPSHNIYEKKNTNYTNLFGEPHVSYPEVEGRIRNYLTQMQIDPELYDLMAMPAEDL